MAAAHQQLALVDARFCFPQQTVLIMQEQLGAFRRDNFNITNAQGQAYFVLAAAPSIAGSRVLLDVYNAPVLQMERKMPSMRGTWLINRASDRRQVAAVRPAMGIAPTVKVFLNDGDEEADFVIQGDFRAKRFDIVHVIRGRGQRVVASVKKESALASGTALLMSMIGTGTSKYFVTIEPGVDAAFVVALATLCDEIFHDDRGF